LSSLTLAAQTPAQTGTKTDLSTSPKKAAPAPTGNAKQPAVAHTAAKHNSTQPSSIQHSSTQHSSGQHTSTAKRTSAQKSKSSRLKKGSKQVAKKHGQQAIDSDRARDIQQALIREHYLRGEPSGAWDSTTQAAMQRFQADQGWQTKTIPDSRALIKLGLGPSHDGLLNPESAMTSTMTTSTTTTTAAPAPAADPKASAKPAPSPDNVPHP